MVSGFGFVFMHLNSLGHPQKLDVPHFIFLEYQFYFCHLQPLLFPFASKVFHEEDRHSRVESGFKPLRNPIYITSHVVTCRDTIAIGYYTGMELAGPRKKFFSKPPANVAAKCSLHL
jgi:hypothetical protein